MDHPPSGHNIKNRHLFGENGKGKNWKKKNQNMGNHFSNEGKKANISGQKFPMKRKMRRGNRPYCEEISVKKNRLEPLRPDKSTIIRKEVIDEIKDGLQLWIRFQENQAASVEASVRRLNGLHSFSKQVEDNGCSGILLFTAIESLEAAKTSLEKNTLIEEVDYMGIRSKTAKVTCEHKSLKLLLDFNYIADEENVKKIHESIISVKLLSRDEISKQSSFVIECQASTENSVQGLIEQLQESVGYNGLREIREYVPLTEQQKVLIKRHLKLIVLRDIPKSATVNDIAALFLYVTGIRIFRKTFPASNYCHAMLLFSDVRAAFRALKKAQSVEVQGKRIFAFPFHHSLMRDLPDLGEKSSIN